MKTCAYEAGSPSGPELAESGGPPTSDWTEGPIGVPSGNPLPVWGVRAAR